MIYLLALIIGFYAIYQYQFIERRTNETIELYDTTILNSLNDDRDIVNIRLTIEENLFISRLIYRLLKKNYKGYLKKHEFTKVQTSEYLVELDISKEYYFKEV